VQAIDNPNDTNIGQQLQLLADAALEHAIFLLDNDGRVTWWSKGAERVFSLQSKDAIGMPIRNIFTATDQQFDVATLERAIAAADAISEDDRWHVRTDGSRFWASGAMLPLRGRRGELLGFGKILRDRTDLKQQLESMQNELADLRQCSAAQDQVIATVTHELRNLFAGFVTGLHMLRSGKGGKDRVEEVSELMEQQLNLLTRLTEDLLQAKSVKAGKVTLELQPTSMQQLLTDVLKHTAGRAESKQQQVQLLAPSEAVVVTADSARLFQIFSNLVDNAIKYTPRQGRIWVKLTIEDRDAVVRVEDSGKGIPADMLPHIFDMFTQVDASAAEGGLGIGLALVAELVRLHAGSVQAASLGANMGSEFTVRLPLHRDRQPATPNRESLEAS